MKIKKENYIKPKIFFALLAHFVHFFPNFFWWLTVARMGAWLSPMTSWTSLSAASFPGLSLPNIGYQLSSLNKLRSPETGLNKLRCPEYRSLKYFYWKQARDAKHKLQKWFLIVNCKKSAKLFVKRLYIFVAEIFFCCLFFAWQ